VFNNGGQSAPAYSRRGELTELYRKRGWPEWRIEVKVNEILAAERAAKGNKGTRHGAGPERA
jgi:hypothetical protein